MERAQSLSNGDLARYLARQLDSFFPEPQPVDFATVLQLVDSAQDRVYRCFEGVKKKYFNEGNRVRFDHLHSDQYSMYLYMLANHLYRSGGDTRLATKLYYLNKALHGIDVFYTAQFPDVFLLVHPVGSVIGRATFANDLVIYQGCTVGCLNDGVFPTFEGSAILYAHSSVLGRCRIGRNVCIAASVSVVNTDVPDDVVVLGSYPNYEFRPSRRAFSERPPFAYRP